MPRQKRKQPEADDNSIGSAESFDDPSDERIRFATERHRRFFRPRVYRRVLVSAPNDTWGCDLATMGLDASSLDANRGFRYLSVFIDIFNRFAWAYPIKQKTASGCFKTFQQAISANDGKAPRLLWSDQGQEYLGNDFKKLAGDTYGVEIYHTVSDQGSAMVERLIRTLREILAKLQSERLTLNWVDLVPKALEIYNNRKHSALGMSPAAAHALDQDGQNALWMHLYGAPPATRIKPSFAVGDWVVVARLRDNKFEKRSSANLWSTDKYRVASVDLGIPPLYTIEDAAGKRVDRRLYAAEMQHTTEPAAAADDEEDVITTIIGERGVGPRKEFQVEWYKGGETWVPSSTITHKGLFSDWKRRQAAGSYAPKGLAVGALLPTATKLAPAVAPKPPAPSKRAGVPHGPPPRVGVPPGAAAVAPAASSRPQRIRQKPVY